MVFKHVATETKCFSFSREEWKKKWKDLEGVSDFILKCDKNGKQ